MSCEHEWRVVETLLRELGPHRVHDEYGVCRACGAVGSRRIGLDGKLREVRGRVPRAVIERVVRLRRAGTF